jgi:UDP-N-acetylglucosamine transferase subunit ALG13
MSTSKAFVFVTVGSTDFDALVQAADEAIPACNVDGIIQIGSGRYTPVKVPHFRFASSLVPYYDQATVVVAHGGVGTTMEVLRRGLPLVSLSNPDRYDNHQDDLLSALSEEGHLIWCQELDQLKQAIELAQTTVLHPYHPPECKIHLVINEFLKKNDGNHRKWSITGRGFKFNDS